VTKADITARIVATTGITIKKANEALEAALNAIRTALKDDLSVDLGRLGKLKTSRLSKRRRVSRGLNNVAPSVFPYSKHAKTVKLKSKLDLSKDPLPTIIHPAPAKPIYIKRPCAIAYPRWRRRNTRA
jgi:nucleoid DNA-binding protein